MKTLLIFALLLALNIIRDSHGLLSSACERTLPVCCNFFNGDHRVVFNEERSKVHEFPAARQCFEFYENPDLLVSSSGLQYVFHKVIHLRSGLLWFFSRSASNLEKIGLGESCFCDLGVSVICLAS